MSSQKKINWKVRFKNKVWLSSFISLCVGFIFNVLRAFDIYPVVTESLVMSIVTQVLTFLGLFGIVADPTTEGLYDSQRALSYTEPWVDKEEDPNGEGNG